MVLDTKDKCYGIIDFISPDNTTLALRDGNYVEIGIPLNRVKLLKPLK